MRLDEAVVKKLIAIGNIVARKTFPDRGRVGVNELVLTELGIRADFGAGHSQRDQTGSVVMHWEELNQIFPDEPQEEETTSPS